MKGVDPNTWRLLLVSAGGRDSLSSEKQSLKSAERRHSKYLEEEMI
jgi:hypothetical protein